MKRLEIIRKDVSPLWWKLISVLIFGATAFKVATLSFFEVNLVVYLVFNVLAVVILIAREAIVIDFDHGLIKEGYRIGVFISGDTIRFSGIEKIFVNKIKLAETFRHLIATTEIHHVQYKAFLKTVEGDKICIGVENDSDKLILKLKEYNKVLKTSIFDTTGVEPILVE